MKKSIEDKPTPFEEHVRKNLGATNPAIFGLNDGKHWSGSGIYVSIKEKCFIATAAHVGRLIEQSGPNVFIMSDPIKGKKLPLNYSKILFPNPKSCEDVLDVCVIVLNGTKKHQPKTGWRFLSLTSISLDDGFENGKYDYIQIGLPFEFSNLKPTAKDPKGLDAILRTIINVTTGYREKDVINYNSKCQLIVKHYPDAVGLLYRNESSEFERMDEKPTSISGMSGGGIWKYRVLKTKSEKRVRKKDLKLVAIEHSWRPNKYIKATKIGYALHLIYIEFPDLPDPLGIYRKKRKGLVRFNDRWKSC